MVYEVMLLSLISCVLILRSWLWCVSVFLVMVLCFFICFCMMRVWGMLILLLV